MSSLRSLKATISREPKINPLVISEHSGAGSLPLPEGSASGSARNALTTKVVMQPMHNIEAEMIGIVSLLIVLGASSALGQNVAAALNADVAREHSFSVVALIRQSMP